MMAIGVYAAFLMLAAALTAKVGFVLRNHGNLLLGGRTDTAGDRCRGPGRERRIRSANRLTLIGFCLVMAGAVALLLRIGGNPSSLLEGLAFIATRGGVLLVVLGLTHFYCLSVMTRVAGAPAGEYWDRAGPARPRSAREDPLDRVFEAARLDAPFGG